MLEKIVAVLDTNIFISGLLSPNGIPSQVIREFRGKKFNVVTSKEQILEIRDVLTRPNIIRILPQGTAKDVLRFLLKLKKLMTIYDPPVLKWAFPDKKDHFLLDLIVHAKAGFLVTGDKQLQSLNKIDKCHIISPQEFLFELKELI